MYLSRRTETLLKIVAASKKPVTARQVAASLDVTVRTVRTDISRAREWLKSSGTGVSLCSKAGVGLWLEGTDDGIRHIIERLGEDATSVADDVCSRKAFIAYKLLTASAPLSMNSLLSELSVSKNVLQQDIKRCKEYLAQYGIEVTTLDHSLIVAEGDERSFRKALAGLIGSPHPTYGGLMFSAISKAVDEEDAGQNYGLLDSTKAAISMHLWAAAQRFQVGAAKVRSVSPDVKSTDTRCLEMASRMLSRVRAAAKIPLPDQENECIALYLEGDRLRQDSVKRVSLRSLDVADDGTLKEAGQVARSIVDWVSCQTGIDLAADRWLFVSLKYHVAWTLNASRAAAIVTNPLKKEIVRKYPGLFRLAKRAAEEYENLSGDLADDEAAYLAMHLGASLQRRLARKSARVLVVCTTGLGSARFLSARLEAMCPDMIILGISSLSEAKAEIDAKKPDMVVSTVDFRDGDTLGIPWVKVSPLLGDEDIDRIFRAWAVSSRVPDCRSFSRDPLEVLETLFTKTPSANLEAFASPVLTHTDERDGPASQSSGLSTEDALRIATIESCMKLSAALHLNADEQLGLLVHALLACVRWKKRDFAPPEQNPFGTDDLAVVKECFRGVASELGFELPEQEHVCMLRYKGSGQS